jgi:hypothetical protein
MGRAGGYLLADHQDDVALLQLVPPDLAAGVTALQRTHANDKTRYIKHAYQSADLDSVAAALSTSVYRPSACRRAPTYRSLILK